ncbi:phosphonate C-P lyase system protein PhnL [Aurantimonas sp. 22II-16-19i]|uniref:phosphonate C-P lyase system protein PhnL n=1 Tax=Aurantimonas sp. 22II-16-19i TaxID=1317114 RepID=UPI0009F7EBF8|nr:phosphonate C-P lyase system protein PhnL [Aurantimonas sp. 22II-16-19i]ORE98564.1 phosphonate C-P lyase system protein PhnL [Aurantimonas sp. 22II-16-19i]
MHDASPQTRLRLEAVAKSFTNHLRGGIHLPVVRDVSFHVEAGEVVVLGGPSGVGKSSILRMITGNYGVETGHIRMRGQADTPFVDLAAASPREIIALRRDVIGYVSQFLRAIPRVSALDVVAEPLFSRGVDTGEARRHAALLLERLNLPTALFELPPATFSGGEKQRVNIARGFLTDHPVLLLDEPTASLDNANRDVVCELIEAKRREGVAILGIFHDEEVRSRIATRIVDVSGFSARKAAA